MDNVIELPIFQMILEPLENGSFGLIFSEEMGEKMSGFMQLVFVIPVKFNEQYWWKNHYYMPGEINGEYIDFKVKPEGEIFYLEDDNFKQSIRFEIKDIEQYRGYSIHDKRFLGPITRLEYVGRQREFTQPFSNFIILSPVDLLLMDDLFYKQKACFVGLTPTFGVRRNYQE